MNIKFQIAFTLVSALMVSSAGSAQNPPPKSQTATFVNSPELSTPPGYSHAAVVNSGKLIFIAGQVGFDKAGKMAGKDDFKVQAAQAFANLKAALAAAGAKPENLIKLNYYVVGLNHEKLLALRELRSNFVNKENPPASTLVGVAALFSEEAQVEIEAVAAIP
jgi:enamine deaminase RidA (YjgF/YER057c/UK114 family)